jgi:hypothetical protein
MRKLLLVIVFALGLMALPGAAKAAPCYLGNNPDGSQSCFHWGDTDRSNGTTVQTHRYAPFDAAFVAPVNTALSNFNSQQGLIRTPASTVGAYPGSCAAGFLQAQAVCAQNFTNACGSISPGYWVGCASYTWWYEWNGSQWVQRPHLGRTEVRFDTAGTLYGNGAPWSWDEEPGRRLQAACHELTGHGMGMAHTASDPGNESCLRSITGSGGTNPFGSTILGSTVVNQIVGNHNHNDLPQGQFGNTAVTSFSKAKAKHSVLGLKPLRQKGVFQLRQGMSGADLPQRALPGVRILSAPVSVAMEADEFLSFQVLPKLKPNNSCMKRGKMAPLARRQCGNGYPVLVGCAYGQGTWDYGPYASPRIRQGGC